MTESEAPECWLPIPGWEGAYEVSELGRVRARDRVITRRDGSKYLRKGRIFKAGPDSHGRPSVTLSRPGVHATMRVHVLVMLAFVGPCPEGEEICHWDGDVTNNQLGNLRYDTRTANLLDRVRHGTHHMAKRINCPRGHPLEEPNLVPSALADGRRSCRACAGAMSMAWKAEREGRPFDAQRWSDRAYARFVANGYVAPNANPNCPRGHLMEEPNLVPSMLAKGKRLCRACHNARSNKGVNFDLQAASDARYEAIMRG